MFKFAGAKLQKNNYIAKFHRDFVTPICLCEEKIVTLRPSNEVCYW